MTNLPAPPPPPVAPSLPPQTPLPPPAANQPPPAPPVVYQQRYQAPSTPKVDGLAIASMVLGILWLYWIGSILAIIFGVIAIRRINRSNGWRTGKGMAIAGLVLGLIGAAFLTLFVFVFAAAGVTSSNNADACDVEQRTFEMAVEAFYAVNGTDPGDAGDLVEAGILRDAGTNYFVTDGVVTARPDGRC